MITVTAAQVPNAKSRFKPRADAGVLSALLQNTWTAVNARLEAERDAADVGETVAAHLERIYPADDMAVLTRYGAAKSITEISVRIYNAATEHWDINVRVDLPRSVVTPGHYGATEVQACGRRWSREEGRGLTEIGRADLATYNTTWEQYCARQDAHEASMLPEHVEHFFTAVVEAREAHHAEYRQTTNWPADRKAATGEWPTWGEIEEAFPTLGEYIADLRDPPHTAELSGEAVFGNYPA
jgi:hypothetical protein